MKLKKLMALALSGVLAVSMLAGCSGEGGTDPIVDNVDENDGIVSVVNSVIDTKADISFAYDSELANTVEMLVRKNGVNLGNDKLTEQLMEELGYEVVSNATNKNFSTNDLNWAEERTVNAARVYKVEAPAEIYAEYQVADKIADVVDGLVTSKADNDEIYNFTYSNAGVCMVSVEVDGTTYYYAAVTLSSTCEKAE